MAADLHLLEDPRPVARAVAASARANPPSAALRQLATEWIAALENAKDEVGRLGIN